MPNRRGISIMKVLEINLILEATLPEHVNLRKRFVPQYYTRITKCSLEVRQVFQMILVWVAYDLIVDTRYAIIVADMHGW